MSDDRTARVTIERPPDFGGILTGIVIDMDGHRVAKVKRGDSVTIEVEPGQHTFRARTGWYGSAPLTLEINNDDHLKLSASAEERASSFTSAFLHPESSLDLKLISP